MARITIEDCLVHVNDRFQLVLLASKRARLLALGSESALIDCGKNKSTVVALREIAAGKIGVEYLDKTIEIKKTVEEPPSLVQILPSREKT